MRHIIRLLSFAGISAVLALGAIGTASAHAELDSSSPAADAALATSPSEVTLTFTEEIQKTSGSYGIAVTNASGASVTSGAAAVGSDDMSLSVALKPDLPDGVYTVVWNNTSADDGDPLSEEFTFTVGTGAAPSAPAPSTSHDEDEHEHDADSEHASAPSGSFEAPTAGFIAVAMNTQHDSGIGGRAELFPVDGGARTRIDVYLFNMTPGSSHMTHVHNNLTCTEAPGSHAADLHNVVADDQGGGISSTTVDVPFSELADGRHIILSHVGADPNGDKTTIACGDIPAQPAGSHPIALPQTGSALYESNSSATLVSIGILLLAGTMIAAGGIYSARRTG